MRSTFSGLNTMVRGIFANQLAQDTTGHNITNAGTEGYSRQKVNQAATRAQSQFSIYGNVLVGTGVDSISLTRARNVYADKQFWAETSTQNYYSTLQTNFDKIEAVFDDSDESGIQHAMNEFYKSWVDLSTQASTTANRITAIEKGNTLADTIQTAAAELQDQINAEYNDLKLHITKFNDITSKITELNKSILAMEASGASANDLRDERDLLADKLSEYVGMNVYEDSNGMYTIVSNGITLVNGRDRLTLRVSEPMSNTRYGINDYNIEIVESGIVYQPLSGAFKGHLDGIAEAKSYMDDLANMSAFLLTTFNDQHKAGAGIDDAHTSGLNFFGNNAYTVNGTAYNDVIYTWDESDPLDKHLVITPANAGLPRQSSDTANANTGSVDYTVSYTVGAAADVSEARGIQIIKMLEVASELRGTDGEKLVAARSCGTVTFDRNTSTITYEDLNGTADGSNAVLLSTLFNMDQKNAESYPNAVQTGANRARAVGTIGLNSYYTDSMTRLGSNSQSIDTRITAQDDIVAQIVNWRASTASVDWNEELTNMLTFQKGYSACSRCLTTMDEMLDRLINNTGVVGR